MNELHLDVAGHRAANARSDGRQVRSDAHNEHRCGVGNSGLVDDGPHDERGRRDAQVVGDGRGEVGETNADQNRVVSAYLRLLGVQAPKL